MEQREFKDGRISDVHIKKINRYLDERGWLCELYRHDELDPESYPRMAYASLTLPGVIRFKSDRCGIETNLKSNRSISSGAVQIRPLRD